MYGCEFCCLRIPVTMYLFPVVGVQFISQFVPEHPMSSPSSAMDLLPLSLTDDEHMLQHGFSSVQYIFVHMTLPLTVSPFTDRVWPSKLSLASITSSTV